MERKTGLSLWRLVVEPVGDAAAKALGEPDDVVNFEMAQRRPIRCVIILIYVAVIGQE